ncbi:hexokinase type 2 isoform X2 [Halyomorpha halys]|nr:hexokinase-1-like [Halyomorpha halys]XP_014282250.1 hexokinase-1-like [Halyomorpha halys]XP_014282251.1 hexokinase-1-like [Halyomorpha halys]
MPELIDIETAIKSQYITQLKLSDSGKEKKVKEVLSCLVLTRDKIVTLANLFSDLLLKGLQYDGTSPFNMQNTFIYQGLEGNESGSFLALDLGGTNYRVVLVELKNGSIVREEVSHYDVPEHLRVGSGPDLFDFFAKSLADFTEKHGISSQKLPLGFTFSFPTDQYALDSAFLQKWAGKYNVSGVVGQDVVKLLNEAISKISGLDVSVVAVVNDTTGALMRGSLIDNEAAIGLILGTGSNACYFEKTKNIPGWKGKQNEVMLNIEWGTFSDDGRTDIIKTKYDDLIDKESLHPNLFTFEKYVGGEFFGKLVWSILKDLIEQSLIFEGRLSESLENSDNLKSEFISAIEEDNIKDSTKNTRRIIVDELGIHWCSDDDISTLKYICEIVSIRMGLLTSIGLSEIIKRMQRKRITVACDGSLHKYHPRLSNYIIDFTSALINYKTEIKLIPAYDGSGVGAALIAAIACKQK